MYENGCSWPQISADNKHEYIAQTLHHIWSEKGKQMGRNDNDAPGFKITTYCGLGFFIACLVSNYYPN